MDYNQHRGSLNAGVLYVSWSAQMIAEMYRRILVHVGLDWAREESG